MIVTQQWSPSKNLQYPTLTSGVSIFTTDISGTAPTDAS